MERCDCNFFCRAIFGGLPSNQTCVEQRMTCKCQGQLSKPCTCDVAVLGVEKIDKIPAFDPKKPVQTRDGRKVRILCSDRVDAFCGPIIALVVEQPSGHEYCYTYQADGRCVTASQTASDLVNIKVKKWKWAVECYDSKIESWRDLISAHMTEEQVQKWKVDHQGRLVGRIQESMVEE